MLKIENTSLDAIAQTRLDQLHQNVTDEPNFAACVARANNQWDSKESSEIGRVAFAMIRDTLKEMTIGYSICNYCEQSEVGDIEHIWPKSFFPLRAFRWSNYLYACKECNTGYKLAQGWVFDPFGGTAIRNLIAGIQPPTEDLCFIDPRAEDPMRCMQLELKDFCFYAKTVENEQARNNLKVEKTLAILELNDREALVANRRFAYKNFRRLLLEYVAAMNSQSHSDLDAISDDDPKVDHHADFDSERQRFMDCTKAELLQQTHLTVFREMQRQINSLPAATQVLFNVSGAHNW
jgi:hypothetical protein